MKWIWRGLIRFFQRKLANQIKSHSLIPSEWEMTGETDDGLYQFYSSSEDKYYHVPKDWMTAEQAHAHRKFPQE